MILLKHIAGVVHYGRFLYRRDGLLVADWCARADFKGPVHQEGFPEAEVRQVAAADRIHELDLAEVEKRIERINRQARKVGAPPVELFIVGEELRPSKHKLTAEGWVPTQVDRYLEVYVVGSQPSLPGGWRLAGVVDYRQAVPLVSTVPGAELPFDPRDRGATCDHCETARARAEVFVLVDAAGAGVQVGRNCLGDFLGLASNDPAQALIRFASLSDVLGFDEEGGGSRGPSGFYLKEILVLSGAIVNVSGWVARSRAAMEGITSTSARIQEYLNPPKFAYECKASAEYREWRAKVSEQLADDGWKALCAEADMAITWAQGRRGSEFEKELADISQCEFLGVRYLGRAAYILPGFRKEQERLNEAARRTARFATSAWLGAEKQRLELDLELVGVKLIDGDYGTTTLATFDDGKGNQVKWFASNFPEWPIGEKRAVKATVKKHDEYKGVKQTVVTRVA